MNTLLSQLLPQLNKARYYRIIWDRVSLTQRTYKTYMLKNFGRYEILDCPPPDKVHLLQPFVDLTKHGLLERTLTPSVLMDAIPGAISFYRERQKLALGSILPRVSTRDGMPSSRLALAVYKCYRCTSTQSLFAYEEVAPHFHHAYCYKDAPQIAYDVAGSQVVSAVLQSLGLDATWQSGITPRDLDNLDAHFVCLQCPPICTFAMTWRQCVSISLCQLTWYGANLYIHLRSNTPHSGSIRRARLGYLSGSTYPQIRTRKTTLKRLWRKVHGILTATAGYAPTASQKALIAGSIA